MVTTTETMEREVSKKGPLHSPWEAIKAAFRDFGDDDCSRSAAALAYYTVFSLPGVLVVVLLILGLFIEPETVQNAISGQFAGVIGPEATENVETIIANAMETTTGGLWTKVIGIGVLAWGGTRAFAALQTALNDAWEVEPERGGLRDFLTKRGVSLLMILTIGAVFLAAMAMTTIISAAGGVITDMLGGTVSEPLLFVLDIAVSLAIFTLLFAAIFKILPDADITWSDVWVGAFGTAILFQVAKVALAFWLGRSEPGSVYGAAGSLIVLLLWVHASSLILLFGAELTQAWVRYKGRIIEPSEGAVKVKERKVRLDEPIGAAQ